MSWCSAARCLYATTVRQPKSADCIPCHGRLLAHGGEDIATLGVEGDMEDALLATQSL